MTNCLKIGDRWFSGDQVIAALVQYKLLDTLIENVLLDEAIQTIALSQQELCQFLCETPDSPALENLEYYVSQWCEDRGVTPTYFKSVVLREWRVEKFKHQYFATQLESEFLRTKSLFDQVEYSLLQLDEADLAQEVYYQIRDDGVEFVDLASTYSLGNERETGGRVGPVPLASLPNAVRARLQPEQIGIIQQPISVGDRYWVVRLEQFHRARLTEATRNDLMNRLFEQWLQSKVNALTAIPGAIAVQPVAS
ncbi:MAG: hypothetical protein NW224_00150 [Leptolyngbyaceae cyanobacterium bins.302]|nr:hypothetical protein [Leptolyngbyaceae cyanobacterium bins.302]